MTDKIINEEIVQINSPYFCAGIIFYNKEAVYAAPILHYMKGWTLQRTIGYCRKKGWRWEKVKTYADPQIKEAAYISRTTAIKRVHIGMQRARPEDNKTLH